MPSPHSRSSRPTSRRHHSAATLILVCALAGCSDAPPAAPEPAAPPPAAPVPTVAPPPAAPAPVAPAVLPQDAFFDHVSDLCGRAFAGYLTVGTEPSDRSIGEADLAIRVSRCETDAIDISFDVGEDRSRTWQLRRRPDALSLHHDHRDPDGTPHDPTGYGGSASASGTPQRQDFPVDDATVAALPAAEGNVWTLEIQPGKRLAYNLERAADDRYFRVEFDLTDPLQAP